MIEAKEAVRAASKWAKEILEPDQFQNPSLEELELEEDGKAWRVTLGFPQKGLFKPANENAKDYKVFRVEAETGDVLGMRMWK
ncbi:MAG TPA: hypothetical protein VN851_23825 [Thermoanaerobaculia bacterium]|nr:hypothetical protein [Thermoanaerobaculia bacterium]